MDEHTLEILKLYFDTVEQKGWEAIDPRLMASDVGVFPTSLLSMREMWEKALQDRKEAYQRALDQLVTYEIWNSLSSLEQASEKILLHFEGLMAWRPAFHKLYTTAFFAPLPVAEFMMQVGPLFFGHLSHFLSLLGFEFSCDPLKKFSLYGRIFEVWLDDDTPSLEKTLGKATEELSLLT